MAVWFVEVFDLQIHQARLVVVIYAASDTCLPWFARSQLDMVEVVDYLYQHWRLARLLTRCFRFVTTIPITKPKPKATNKHIKIGISIS